MKITQDILDDLTAKAKESPRLRMNLDFRDSAEDTSQETPGQVPVSQTCSVMPKPNTEIIPSWRSVPCGGCG